MNRIKSAFISLYSMGAIITCLHSLGVIIFSSGLNSAWLGAFIATLPAAVFFSRILTVKDLARTSNNLPIFFILGFIGFGLSLVLPSKSFIPVAYAFSIGALGTLLYVFWYSRIDRSAAKIEVGKTLPDFTLQSSNGDLVEASTLRQQAALILFFRGNWCPLCMAQIKEIAASYQELNKRGVKVYLVSPQSERHSQSLAKQFDAPMEFMVDKNLQAAKTLGLFHENGTPIGMMGYKSDTVMPTAILSDENGQVIFADLTDNYRVRPEPQAFIDILDKHLANA